jgi:hypothetical protein
MLSGIGISRSAAHTRRSDANPQATMTRAYLLVDFENVQPSTLGTHVSPESEESFVKVFAGAQQSKIDLSLAQALQALGPRAEYIQIAGTGKDALDFHIAYYIGRLAVQHPGSAFTILSKDTGFDPLIKHLEQHQIRCQRVQAIDGKEPIAKASPGKAAAKLPPKTVAKANAKAPKKVAVETLSKAQCIPQRASPNKGASAQDELQLTTGKFNEIVQRLVGLKDARPGNLKTLRSSLMTWSKPPLSAAQIDVIVEKLQSQNLVKITGSKVAYTLSTLQK